MAPRVAASTIKAGTGLRKVVGACVQKKRKRTATDSTKKTVPDAQYSKYVWSFTLIDANVNLNGNNVQVVRKDSLLLKLPGELRNKIYGYVFGEKHWFIDQCGRVPKRGKRWGGKNAMSLLRVCRQLHAETRCLPYQTHTFAARYQKWLQKMAG